MRVLGGTRTVRLAVAEPEPGRVLLESEIDGTAATTFTVDSEGGGAASRVTIDTTFAFKGGVGGAVEAFLTAWMLSKIYRRQLELLAQRVAAG